MGSTTEDHSASAPLGATFDLAGPAPVLLPSVVVRRPAGSPVVPTLALAQVIYFLRKIDRAELAEMLTSVAVEYDDDWPAAAVAWID
jgi:hypothetical protein